MRKIFHFVSAFGASIASYMGVESIETLNTANEINVTAEAEKKSHESDQYNFPIHESLLNNKEENAGFVLISNSGQNENSSLLNQDNLANVNSDIDNVSNQDEIAEDERDLPISNANSLAVGESDSTDMELSSAELEKLDSSQIVVVKEESNIYRDLEVSGLIMDDTRSKIGRDFYEFFFNTWNAQPQVNTYYSIEIIEKAARGSVSQIIVKVNEAEVMRQFVQLRSSEIEDMASKAVYRVRRYLANEREMRNRLLEESDQMGSGLF